MKLAMDSACTSRLSRRIVSPVLALATCLIVSGCAGWSSLGDQRSYLAGMFWHRRDTLSQAPGYDLYAESMAAARPPTTKGATPTSRASNAEDNVGPRTSSSEETVPLAEAAPPPPTSARKRNLGRSNDASIRVTLGRPESLPILADSGQAAEPLLARASSNWKRPSEPATDAISGSRPPTTRSRSTRPVEEPEPPRRVASQMPRATSREDKLQSLLTKAKVRLESMSTYQVNITRVERVGGQLQPEEDVLLSIRRNPKAVRLEWATGPSKGREVIYSSAINDRTMYVNMADSPLPLSRMSIPVDSPLALRNSRHPITEAGFDTILDGLFKFHVPKSSNVQEVGKLVYKGIERPKELDRPCHLIERSSPKGETWRVYLDSQTLMPAVVLAYQTAGGEPIERYTYRNLKPNPTELASAEAFDPDKRWGESKSWLSRLARAAGPSSGANSAPTTTR
jgi:hypothetical protein